MKTSHYTGIILAGGENKRFNGSQKAFMPVDGKPIIAHIIRAFKDLFDEIIVVTNSPLLYLHWNISIVKDIYPVRSSLTGIHAGLFYTKTPYAFITACDTPFIQPALIQHILKNVQPTYDVVIPRTRAGFEPLCAVYSKRCLQRIDQLMLQKKHKIQSFFHTVTVKTISEATLRSIDPELLSFFNINTPQDLTSASMLLKNTFTGDIHDIQ